MANITFGPKQDGYISEWDVNGNFCNDRSLYIGRYLQPGDSFRSLLQFDLCRIPPTSQIEEAELVLFLYRNEAPCAVDVTIHRLLNNWCKCNVTWNNQPSYQYEPDGLVTVNNEQSGFIKIFITELAAGWYDGSIPNNGLILIGNEDLNSVLGCCSSNCNDSSEWPKLRIKFVDGILDIYESESLVVPCNHCPLIDSTPIPLGPRKMVTFMVENMNGCYVEAKLQLSYSDFRHDTFFDASPWLQIKPKGCPGEGIVITSTDAAEYARVLIRGKGGEKVLVYPRTKEM